MAGATSLDGTALCLVTSTETKFSMPQSMTFFLWIICEFILPAMHKQSNQARCTVFIAITETENPPPNVPTEKRQPPLY